METSLTIAAEPAPRIVRPLSPEELTLLRVVRMADEDGGGLAFDDLGSDELTALGVLEGRGLIETRRDEAGDGWARISARGVEALRHASAY